MPCDPECDSACVADPGGQARAVAAVVVVDAYGFILGIGLLIVVSGVGWALGAKANRGVRQFREEHHESFLGRKPR